MLFDDPSQYSSKCKKCHTIGRYIAIFQNGNLLQCIQHFLVNGQLFNFNIYLQGMFYAKTGFCFNIYCIYNEPEFIQDGDTFKYI